MAFVTIRAIVANFSMGWPGGTLNWEEPMKRWAMLVSLFAVALVLGPVGSSQAADLQATRMLAVQNPVACRAAMAANPTFTSAADVQAFTAAGGPCAVATTGASSPLLSTMACAIGQDFYGYNAGFGLNDWVSSTFSLSCTGGTGTPIITCYNVMTIPDAVPTVVPTAGEGSGGCDTLSLLQETPAALHVAGVQVGLIIAVDLKGDVGVAQKVALRST
jgi:hypothetical protein